MPVPFKQFDLGSVIQTAEAIKGMRRDEQNDKIRNAYMGEQISQMQASRPLAAAKEQRDQQQFDQQNDAENAKRNYLVARAVKGSQDPHGDIRRFAPEFVQEVDQHYGPGAFDQMTGEQLQMAMGKAEQFYGAKAGFDPAAPQKLDALVEYVDNKGNPVYGTREQALGKKPYHQARAGISMTSPDGTQIEIGGDGVPNYGGVGLTKPNQTKLQEAFINAQGNAYALREQIAKYKPEFSTYSGRAKAGIANLKEQAGMENAPQQTAYLNDFTSWKADTARVLSQYLNQLSGAAISPAEEARLKGGFPSADDGPTQYQAKAASTMRNFSLVQARAAYLLSNPSQSMDSVSLDSMSGIIAKEANRVAESLQRGGMEAEAAKSQAIQATRQRYGLDNAQ